MEDDRIECTYCNKNIAEGIPFCPYCGTKQPQALSKDEINKDPYEILQITEDAELEVIEAAYKSLARKYHPDSGTSSVSEERMREINWAHGILTDPDKLAEWKMKHQRKQSQKYSPTVQASPNKKSTGVNERQSRPVSYPPPPSSTNVGSKNPSNSGTPLGWIIGIIGLIIFIGILVGIFSSGNTHTTYQPSTPIPTRRPINTPTRQPSSMLIKYTNTCSMTIETAIYYQTINGNWITDGWWELSPGETANIVRTINPTFYTYGISKDGNSVWEGTAIYQTVRGSSEVYGFDYTYIQDWDAILQSSGDFEIEFLCK